MFALNPCEPISKSPPAVKVVILVSSPPSAFTFVTFRLPKDAVDAKELVTLFTTTNLPNEPVDVSEPLTFAALTTAEPLIRAFKSDPKLTRPVAVVIEFCVAV